MRNSRQSKILMLSAMFDMIILAGVDKILVTGGCV